MIEKSAQRRISNETQLKEERHGKQNTIADHYAATALCERKISVSRVSVGYSA